MQKKVQRAEIRQLKSLHFPLANPSEVSFDPFGRDFANQQRIEIVSESDQAYVGGVALVAGARMSKLCQLDLHVDETIGTLEQ